MDQQYLEITEIPQRALDLWKNGDFNALPLKVPYLGMGSSYFAPLAFKYMGIDIYPEMASEFFNYQDKKKALPLAVILSQSGRSTEALWCTQLFEKYIAVSNYPNSPLCTGSNMQEAVLMMAGEEKYSSSNTYVNTLLALFKGFGMDARAAIDLLVEQMPSYEAAGKELAEEVYELISTKQINGIYITGSGPNVATACQAGLIMSESTKRDFHGLPMAQYDHGPKETAENSIVIQILSKGPSYQRSLNLSEKIKAAGAYVFTVEEPKAEENFSVLHTIIPFNFMAYYLAGKLKIGETFTVGGKVTEVV